ncbi:helix-turn-helix domain-containing protein [Kitasatospora sp. NPDC051705]|uniref:helix-turn-helix domain-containing protein n=1 Tax=Kitasatospora sp. NPDC051705 TaxID=3364057 RepID=UPI0037B4415A
MRETEEVAQLLQELKSRSGLSYGGLAKRLHLSTSALHRYCNGDVMPTEFAPLDHLSRVCGATPQERVELYRLWLVVRATRGTRTTSAPGAFPGREESPETLAAREPAESPAPAEASEPEPEPEPEPAAAPEPAAPAVPPARRRARRRGVLAVVTVIAVLLAVGAVAIGLRSRPDGSTDPARAADVRPLAGPPSVAASTAPPLSVARAGAGAGPSGATGGTDPSTSAPITVAVHPSGWNTGCDQYVVDRPPSEVPRPPAVADVPGWVSRVGAVPGRSQSVKLTIQGTSLDTVLLTGLNVRVTRVAAPLAWNAYSMGEGCPSGVGANSYAVDLDAARPVPVVAKGSGGLPVRVTESDQVVIEVTAETTVHDVSWYLELEWASANRKGMVPVDLGQGTPFRTSPVKGRPLYVHPADGHAWEPAPPPR